MAKSPAQLAREIQETLSRKTEAEDGEVRAVDPRCVHGAVWNACGECTCTAWCEDCGARIVLDEPIHPEKSATCESCVERTIGNRKARRVRGEASIRDMRQEPRGR